MSKNRKHNNKKESKEMAIKIELIEIELEEIMRTNSILLRQGIMAKLISKPSQVVSLCIDMGYDYCESMTPISEQNS